MVNDDSPRVGIVGAGITGLALTHYLAEQGIDSVAYEASDRPGGVIDSRTVDGRVLEVGPQRLRLTDELDTMIDDLDRRVAADETAVSDLRESLLLAADDLPLYVYANGDLRVVPRSPSAFLATDLLSWRAKLRVLAEPLTEDGSPDESIAGLFSRKFGDEAYENLVEPILGGTFGSDPARMPVRHALSGALSLEKKHGNLLAPAAKRLLGSSETPPPASFDEGLQRLPRALAEAHADRVELGTAVESIEPLGAEGDEDSTFEFGVVGDGGADGDAVSDDSGAPRRDAGSNDSGDESEHDGSTGVVLTLDDGCTERFDHVIVTTPASAAADILSSAAPESAAALGSLTYNPLVLVHLESDADATGFGYQVRRSEPLRTLGVSWNASLFDREGVYTAFLGGMDDHALLDLDANEIGEIAAGEFQQVMGEPARVLHVEKLPDAFPAYDDSWDALDRVDLPDSITLATNYTARMGIPSRVREAKRLAASFGERPPESVAE